MAVLSAWVGGVLSRELDGDEGLAVLVLGREQLRVSCEVRAAWLGACWADPEVLIVVLSCEA